MIKRMTTRCRRFSWLSDWRGIKSEAGDPILEQYKRTIGPRHFTPAQIMAWQAANHQVIVPPADIRSGCLHHQGRSCLKRVQRCPAGAVNENGHDKEACSNRVKNSLKHCNRNYHIFIHGCELCATGVPGESRDPATTGKQSDCPPKFSGGPRNVA